MAAISSGWRSAVLHWQHEPLRRYLHRERPTTGATRRRRYHGSAICRQIPSYAGLGRSWYCQRQAVPVDVDIFVIPVEALLISTLVFAAVAFELLLDSCSPPLRVGGFE
jgi:hypothetical protein